jgi:hypothetical protein
VYALTQDNPVTIVVETMGELGNFLHFNAHGYGLYDMAKSYGINARIIFRRQQGTRPAKAKKTVAHLHECFPHFERFQLDDKYDPRKSRQLQEEWLGEEVASRFQIHKLWQIEEPSMDETFRLLQQAILEKESNPPQLLEESNTGERILKLPFLQVSVMKNLRFIDENFDVYHDLFQMDEEKCCKELPESDEEVFVSFLYIGLRLMTGQSGSRIFFRLALSKL